MTHSAVTCCSTKEPPRHSGKTRPASSSSLRYALLGALGLLAWWLVYRQLLPAARFLSYDLFKIGAGTHLGAAVEFFLYDTPKVMMLLALVVFWVGSVLAALLGIVTPFCSCWWAIFSTL